MCGSTSATGAGADDVPGMASAAVSGWELEFPPPPVGAPVSACCVGAETFTPEGPATFETVGDGTGFGGGPCGGGGIGGSGGTGTTPWGCCWVGWGGIHGGKPMPPAWYGW